MNLDLTQNIALGDGRDNGRVGKVGKVSNISTIGDGSDKGYY